MRLNLPVLLRRSLVGLVVLATSAGWVTAGPPAHAGNRATPGNFTGFGFDQCLAPTQAAMDAWLKTSPYWAVGIYISGASRACRHQPNLDRRWVSTQLRNGWRLLPLTVGPQAACSTREDYQDEVRIRPDPTRNYLKARKQGRKEAAKTVRAARALGIVKPSTLWYDLEAFSTSGTRCRESALSFLSSWTKRLHDLGYVSGVYSSAASGTAMLDDIHDRPGRHTLPDRIWIADWNGKANLQSSYVRASVWTPHKRVHQYRGGHLEKHGGVTINIDSNYMSLGRGSVPPPPKRHCGVGIDRRDYSFLQRRDHGSQVKSLQCLLTIKGSYTGKLHGKFTLRTAKAVRAYQRGHDLTATGRVTVRMWTVLLAEGANPVLKFGSAGRSVQRVQRALNAAVDARLPISGVYRSDTTRAVRAYQRLRGLPANGVMSGDTWVHLERGLLGAR